jgi:hypothetical protein
MICSIIVAISLAVSTLAVPTPTREYSYILGVPDILTLFRQKIVVKVGMRDGALTSCRLSL